MATVEIKNFDEFFNEFFGTDNKLIKYETKNLTKPGDNYGSIMLSVKIVYKKHSSSSTHDLEETVQAVAKLIPDNEMTRQMFQPSLTFKKERELYRTVVPTLQQFSTEQGLDGLYEFFPKLYGSRANLDKNDSNSDDYEIDFDSAILLLENLINSGYRNANRVEGFNLDEARLVITTLAEFHAVPIALKQIRPDDFRTKVRPFLTSFPFAAAMDDDIKQNIIDANIDCIKRNKRCLEYLTRVRKAMSDGAENVKTFQGSELFSTIVHNDFWVNNIMLKFDKNNKPVNAKILDFQVTEYNSAIKDLVFLIFSSIQTSVIQQHYEELVELYYTRFTSVLKSFKCNTDKITLDEMNKEIAIVARKTEFYHIAFMLAPILATEVLEQEPGKKIEHSEQYKEKIIFIVQEFAKRNWI